MNKQTAIKLKKYAENLLKTNGFTPTPDKMYNYHKQTKIGEVCLTIYADKNWRRRGWNIWIAGRWIEPKKAIAAGKSAARISGKDNYLCLESESDIEYALEQLNFEVIQK